MPPPNDAFANATVISGRSGVAYGDNVGATGNDVWWKWTTPANIQQDGSDSPSTLKTYYFFTTHADITHGASQLTDFDTILDLHSDETTVLTPLIASSSDNFGSSRQSYAVCFVAPGDVVYIRVRGVSGAEGNIRLVWGMGARRFIGGAQVVRLQNGLLPRGWATVASVFSENTVDFDGPYGDTFDAGTYVVRYVSGAFAYKDEDNLGSPVPPEWATTRFNSVNAVLFVGADTGAHDVFIRIEHTDGTVNLPFDAISKPSGVGTPHHPNATHAANHGRGAMKQFHHDGGKIKLHFIDDKYTDNVEGDPLPTFHLYRSVPIFEATAATFSTVGPSSDSGTVFGLQLLVPRAFSNLTFTLLTSGGITSPSADVTDSFTALQTKNVGSFSYNVSTNLAVAVIRVSEDGFAIQDISFDFTPSLTIGAVSSFSGIGGTPAPRWEAIFPLTITNGPTRNLTCTVVASNAAMSSISTEVQNASLTTTGAIVPGAAYARVKFTAANGSHPDFTIEMTDGTLNFGQKSYNVQL